MVAATHPQPGMPAHAPVVVVDDHELLGESLTFALERRGTPATRIPVTTEEEVLARIAAARPAAALLDLDLGPLGSAVPIIAVLRERDIPVVVMTGNQSRAAWGECLEAGAVAVISKVVAFDALLDVIEQVACGEDPLDPRDRAEMLDALRERRSEERARFEPFERLSTRECEVLHDLMLGLSAEAIAEASYVSLSTVRSHIRAILQKLGVSSQLAAVAMAVRAGWRSPSVRRH